MPTEQEKRLQRCCFTGQRPEKLTESPEAVQQWLKEQIENAIVFANERIIPASGLAVVGGMLAKSNLVKRLNRKLKRSEPQIKPPLWCE